MRQRHTAIRAAMLVASAALIFTACSKAGATAAPTGAASTEPSSAASASAAPSEAAASIDPNDLLAIILKNGVIRVGTDPAYPPQSLLKPDGTFEGFDIDTANEIGKRLGVKVEFVTPDFSVVEAGKWAGRFDISVGSVTITKKRLDNLDFTSPSSGPACSSTATTASGITTLDGLAGKTVCVGEATTYYQWISGTLALGDGSALAPVPAGMKVTTLKTDQDCALSVKSGRHDFEGWLSSSTTVAAALAAKTPMIIVGAPVFNEPLAVATDKSGPPHAALQAALDRIIKAMHADGTLSASSKKWFDGLDMTVAQ